MFYQFKSIICDSNRGEHLAGNELSVVVEGGDVNLLPSGASHWDVKQSVRIDSSKGSD